MPELPKYIQFGDAAELLLEVLAELSPSSVYVLLDNNGAEYCLPRLQESLPDTAHYLQIPEGEEYKQLDTCKELWQTMLDSGADRSSVLICLGGGVITDLGGYVASSFMRGIDFVHIPSTLLAQTDAAIGGKTGVDLGAYKNMIGSFSLAHSVIIDPKFLSTLSDVQYISGFAEILKHALIADGDLAEELFSLGDPLQVDLTEILPWSISIKSNIVDADMMENGARKMLNFGHTVGHAIESFYLKNGDPVLHGNAVARGIQIEAQISRDLDFITEEWFESIYIYTQSHFELPVLPKFSELKPYLARDKKNAKGVVKMILLKGKGEVAIDQEFGLDDLKDYFS